MEFIDVLENVPKDKFRAAANKLLNECFIIRKNRETASEYNFIRNYRSYFISLFDVLGYELIIQEELGVIGINNPAGTGRIHLKKIESILLLILRLLYIEERKKISQTGDVIVIMDQVYDKYNMLKLPGKLDKTTLRNSMGLFRRYHLIQNLDTDMSNPETRVLIYPSILLAVASSDLDELYQAAKDKLSNYAKGGEEYEDAADRPDAAASPDITDTAAGPAVTASPDITDTAASPANTGSPDAAASPDNGDNNEKTDQDQADQLALFSE